MTMPTSTTVTSDETTYRPTVPTKGTLAMKMQNPHVPTLAYALVGVVIILALYHVAHKH